MSWFCLRQGLFDASAQPTDRFLLLSVLFCLTAKGGDMPTWTKIDSLVNFMCESVQDFNNVIISGT